MYQKPFPFVFWGWLAGDRGMSRCIAFGYFASSILDDYMQAPDHLLLLSGRLDVHAKVRMTLQRQLHSSAREA